MRRTLTFLIVAVFGMYGASVAQTIGVSIAVSGGSNVTCQGRNVTFSATPTNAGNLPNYQWFVNGIPAPGAVGGSFTTNTLVNNDQVTAQVQRSFTPFDSAMSQAITMIVVPNVTPTVTKAITIGANPGCAFNQLQFTATAANAGLTPAFRWFVNGVSVATGSVYSNFTGVTGDKVWVRAIASGSPPACYSRDTAYSDTTTLVRLPVPALPVISFIGDNLISDSTGVQWYGPAGIIPGATGNTYRPVVQGEYYALIPKPLCGTGKSNVLIISPLEVGGYALSGLKISPNPTSGKVTISWGSPVTARITVYTPSGQAVMHESSVAATTKTLDLSQLASGMYFILLQDRLGLKGAVRVTLTH